MQVRYPGGGRTARAILWIVLACLVFLTQAPSVLFSQPAAGTPRPNILFIMADDLGYGDVGSYGQKQILTPQIDRLAREGMRLTQAYAGAPVCAPSRCSLMTGMHGGHSRIRDNLPLYIALRPDDFTVAELLQQAGYATGAIGKWSLGNPGSWGVANYQGFDYFYGHLNQDQAHYYYPHYLWENDRVIFPEKLAAVDGVTRRLSNRGGENNAYTHDLFTEKAMEFIDRHREDPFFLYLAYTIPHFSDYPKDTPEHFMVPSDEPYGNRSWPQASKNYAAMITRMDRDVGRIMQQLQELGISRNTIVFFTSDNGPYSESELHSVEFFDSNGRLRGVKRDVYEGGIRVPFIVRWPEKIQPGQVNDHVLAFWDLMPTVAQLVGLPVPEGIDGISFLPSLLGIPQQEHEYLYWDYGHSRETYKQAVRSGKWKAARVGALAPIELYDLEKDAGETRNVALEHPEMVARMEQLMESAVEKSPDYYPLRELEKLQKK